MKDRKHVRFGVNFNHRRPNPMSQISFRARTVLPDVLREGYSKRDGLFPKRNGKSRTMDLENLMFESDRAIDLIEDARRAASVGDWLEFGKLLEMLLDSLSGEGDMDETIRALQKGEFCRE